MKKILLTLVAGFCLSGLAMAQDPAKAANAKKKTAKATTDATTAARLKAKEEKAKAIESGNAAPQSDKFSKDPGAKKAN